MGRWFALASILPLLLAVMGSGCRRPSDAQVRDAASSRTGREPATERRDEAPMKVPTLRPEDALAQPVSGEVYDPPPPRMDLPSAPPEGSGVALPAGAQPNALTEEGEWVVASYVTDSPFGEVKSWYLARLTEADGWRNDGIEAAPLGTDEWEFVHETTGERVRLEALPGMPTTIEIRVAKGG